MKSSVEFINALNDNQLKIAYLYTTQKGEYFHSYQSFTKKATKEFLRHHPHYAHKPSIHYATIIEAVFRYSHPPQSYGNRLRRWMNGHKVDMKWKNLDFFLFLGNDKKFLMPFEVRWELQSDEQWKIVYFQSHAA